MDLAGPAGIPLVAGMRGVEEELAQVNDSEPFLPFAPQLAGREDGRSHLILTFAGIAGQDQPKGSQSRDSLEGLEITGAVYETHDMVTTTVEEKVEGSGEDVRSRQ